MQCAVETYSTFELANDKQKLMEVCEKYDIVHPYTRALPEVNASFDNAQDIVRLEFRESLKSVAEYVEFPAMIKPNLSAGAKGITKVEIWRNWKNNILLLLRFSGLVRYSSMWSNRTITIM